jgi:hypothetical protein
MRLMFLCSSWIAAAFILTDAVAQNAGTTATAQGPVRISIENEYKAHLNFGVLGKGSRDGKDKVTGVLDRQGDKYVGEVDARVKSTQTMSGLAGGCPSPAMPQSTYDDSQQLRVTGHLVNGFNTRFQSVPANVRSQSSEYLLLEFVPKTRTTTQPQNRDPYQDTVVNCHTLIETEATIDNRQAGTSSILFLPLNDTRWTMKGGGYIIALPSSGDLQYTDNQVIGPMAAGPFEVEKSVWRITVERLPAGWEPPGVGGQPPTGPGGCPQNPSQSGSSPPGSRQNCVTPPSTPSTPR